MKTFDSLTEQEVLALAIALEEEDARIYEDFADGLQGNYPEQAEKFRVMRREEDGHRHRRGCVRGAGGTGQYLLGPSSLHGLAAGFRRVASRPRRRTRFSGGNINRHFLM